MPSLRIYVADPHAPHYDGMGRYYQDDIPKTVIGVPPVMTAPGFPHLPVRLFVIKDETDITDRWPNCPTMTRLGDLAWGVRFKGSIYVRGGELTAVLMSHQALLQP